MTGEASTSRGLSQEWCMHSSHYGVFKTHPTLPFDIQGWGAGARCHLSTKASQKSL